MAEASRNGRKISKANIFIYLVLILGSVIMIFAIFMDDFDNVFKSVSGDDIGAAYIFPSRFRIQRHIYR